MGPQKECPLTLARREPFSDSSALDMLRWIKTHRDWPECAGLSQCARRPSLRARMASFRREAGGAYRAATVMALRKGPGAMKVP